MSAPDDMALPEGKTCGDCRHWLERCRDLFGVEEGDMQYCDWYPSRFAERDDETHCVDEPEKEGKNDATK